MGIAERLRHAWNAFANPKQEVLGEGTSSLTSTSYGTRPDRSRARFSNERSIISSIYTRLAIDVASVAIRHVRLDENNRYVEEINSGLNECFRLEANMDQNYFEFMMDIAYSLFDLGHAAVAPIKTDINPALGSYDVKDMRVGEITKWSEDTVLVNLFNEKKQRRQDLPVGKQTVAIIQNPLYAVMNEPNSTLQRIIRQLNLLDAVNEQMASGKLDLIIQLPYTIRTDVKREQAEQRRKDIEFQLEGSKYGVAYTDGTEKITQLNRPVENNMLSQVEFLFKMLYGQLGLTEEVMNGTADEKTMLNYYNRTIWPILTVITVEFKRKFLTKTARTQRQSIEFFRDPFKLVPLNDIAEIADKLTRNEILSSNEFRGIIGFKPADDPKADELRNSNMPMPEEPVQEDGTAVQSAFDGIDKAVDEIFADLEGSLNDT